MSMYLHKAIVSCPNGLAVFPIDMLRYDRCFPEDCASAAKIDFAMHRKLEPDAPIMVACYRPTKASPWTVERWSSFGWQCKPIDVRKMS